MRNLSWLGATTALGLLVLAVAGADKEEKEEKVPLNKLPRKVVAAVKARFSGAKLVSAEKENENGKLVYEVAIEHKGDKIEVTVTPGGKIVSVEKEISVKRLPQAVLKTLQARYPRAEYKKAEEVTRGKKVTYEVLLVTADKKKFEVELTPTGKIVEVESKDKKKPEKDKKDGQDKQ